ncbi:tripartite tricarboxylate transporter substrate-binding protein [Cupriavidus necator]|uniref:tripartite tricarboxylate transporter substrate-binding protein n=1 Tax=Cupriavidus TaxID=106589 RepID=UPI00399A0891
MRRTILSRTSPTSPLPCRRPTSFRCQQTPASRPFRTTSFPTRRPIPETKTSASAGNGTSDHLTADLFWQKGSVLAENRHNRDPHTYMGGAPAKNDLPGGQVDATFMNLNTAVPHIKAGKLRARLSCPTCRPWKSPSSRA